MTDSTASAAPAKAPNAGKKAKDLNEVIRYTLWSVFRLRDVLPDDRTRYAEEVEEPSSSSPRRTSRSAARTTCPGCAPTRTS